MWFTVWFNRNLAKGSEVNGGLLSVVKHLGVPYCERVGWTYVLLCLLFLLRSWWWRGYLLKVSVISRYSLFLNLKKSVAGSCQGASGTSLGIIGWVCWVALCWIHVLHHFTYLAMSTSIPGQYSVALALCSFFSIPRCILCNSFSDLS